MKVLTRNTRSTVAARLIPAARAASASQPQSDSSQQRRPDGTELRFQLLLAALRPSAG
jgi:hypothetical protein